jgi:hypothetical protein
LLFRTPTTIFGYIVILAKSDIGADLPEELNTFAKTINCK